VNALTLAELRKHQADLAWKAEKLRQEWRTPPMGNRSTTMGKQVKAMQERADDYAAIIKGLEAS
jgi:hypothetical protein